ncbi:hypothetical protein BS78_10G184600 [Paspalum vaginatum]|nr:hypothetical protein BS78_10G184600 [Paspalum vaginatum]
MKLIAWNCRGLGNDPAVRNLLKLQKEEDPDILFLSETKLDRNWIDGLRWRLGLTNLVVKNSDGRNGGLAIFWRKGVNFHLRDVSRLYIDGDVTEEDGFVWRFTGFYGGPRSDRKELSWQALRALNAARKHPWLCVGDFNEILMSCEKEGGVVRLQSCMDKFRDALEECSLSDLGFTGDPFTWRNHCGSSDTYIKERLDRAVADEHWRDHFLAFHVRNGDPKHSDHRPVIVEVERSFSEEQRSGEKSFCFEAGWVQEEDCDMIVKNAWGLSMEARSKKVRHALGEVAAQLTDWSRNVLGDLEKRIKHTKKELEACRRRGISKENVERENLLRYKMQKLEEQKDIYWRQRAHANWLKNGDRNTTYFQQYASERRKKNRIKMLKREDGREEYSDAEIKYALDCMGDLKAPGADGIPALFYKRYWHIVGEAVTKEVKNLLTGGDIHKGGIKRLWSLYPRCRTLKS